MEKCFKLSKFVNIDTNELLGPVKKPEIMKERILMCSLEKIPLLDFDLSGLSGKKITKAELLLHCDTKDFPTEVFVSTVTSDWTADSVMFRKDGSVITDCIMGLNGSVYEKREAVFSEWTNTLKIEIPPAFAEAAARGESYGFAVIDYRSKTFLMTKDAWLLAKPFYAFSDCEKTPELKIYYENTDSSPGAINNKPCESKAKQIPVSSVSNVKIEIPELPLKNCLAAKTKSFSVYALDEFTKVNPIDGNVPKQGCEDYPIGKEFHVSNKETAVFDGKSISFRAVAGEKLAFQLVIHNETENPLELDISFTDMEGVLINKAWYLHIEDAWYPEAAVPLYENGKICVPFKENGIIGQSYQSVFIDINVPETAEYSGKVNIGAGEDKVVIPIRVLVHDIKLDKADFVFDLTGYSSVPNFMGSHYGDEDYFEIEDGYYRVAHNHNGQINVVPYSQNGNVRPGFAPKAIFENGFLTGLDWKEWDIHFERLLNGAYLEEKTGKREPISHMCIPIHENWPCSIDDYYKAKVSTSRYPDMVNEDLLRRRSFDEDFRPGYWESIKKALVEFIKHTDEKGYQNINFIWFINNKHYWKDRTKKEGSTLVGGTSWWLLDEPLISQDWEAVAHFGKLLREAQKETGSGKNFKFRIDISMYNTMFDFLDGLLDIACLNGASFNYMRDYHSERKAKFGEEIWNYGHLGQINASFTAIPLNIMNIYLCGGTGFLPWQNYGNDEHYEIPSSTATLYPGNRFGLKEPIPSLRFKAVRKGMELLNYLDAFKRKHALSDKELKAVVSRFVSLDSNFRSDYFEDAGTTEFKAVDFCALEGLKIFILDDLLS